MPDVKERPPSYTEDFICYRKISFVPLHLNIWQIFSTLLVSDGCDEKFKLIDLSFKEDTHFVIEKRSWPSVQCSSVALPQTCHAMMVIVLSRVLGLITNVALKVA